ncbi:MAG TPA: saccharopine dehydrogenase NADP-binding domain-containing protein [Dermatophilaceae bacterium]|nr:saccharopine dehydrogenase NADP-binding domain-containing protein [Dermatophilaceae bacterium]
MTSREHDVVLHGATGFVGRLTARHLAAHAGEARVALSGRSKDKLLALRDELGVDWPVLVADAGDAGSLAGLAASTTAVATTVGPFAKHGLPLVRACAEAGTSYADLTGEVLFVRESAAAAHDRARETGARIVHAAGFDSVPSDLGVLLLHERVAADGEGTLEETVLLVVSMRGGVSGGTIDSMRTQVDVVRADPALGRVLADSFALSPDRTAEPDPGSQKDPRLPSRDPLLGRWVAPFVMAPFNTRIVRRSNALQEHAYGPGFRYREVMGVGRGLVAPVVAGAIAAGLAGVAAGMALPPTRLLLDRVLPRPGSGPSEKAQRGGHFRLEVHTRTSTGARYVATVAAQGDPGYAATAVMLGESALCLGLDTLSSAGGVLTPAVAMGDHLVARLRGRGFELSVSRTS